MTDTVRRLCLTGALALTTAASGQNATPSFSITISGPSEVKAGSASYVDIVVENVTNHRITLGYDAAIHHAQSSFVIDIRDSAGRVPAYYIPPGTPPGWKTARSIQIVYADLKPGEKLNFRLDLHEVFELTPGKYTVQLSHHENAFAMYGPEKPQDPNVPGHKEARTYEWKNEPSPNSNLKVDSNDCKKSRRPSEAEDA